VAPASAPALPDLLQGRPFVDCYVIGLVALDDVLWLFFGSVALVTLEDDLRGYFLLDRSSNAACFRVPFDMIATFEISRHNSTLQAFSAYQKGPLSFFYAAVG